MALFDKARQQPTAASTAPVATTKLVTLSSLPALNESLNLPLGINLFPHQEVPVQAVRDGHRSLLIGDEMGVGKTATAIAVIEDQQAYPTVVVVPPSLTLNWEREFARAVPHRTVARLAGVSVGAVPSVDILIVPDSIVAAWATRKDEQTKKVLPIGPLVRPWKALVVDECHRLKNEKAARTKGVMSIARGLPADSIRLLMSGTPLINRPVELASPLTILGKLQPLFGSLTRFRNRYCGAQYNGYGMVYNGATNVEELNEMLRANVMIRRLRSDVLTLPNKGRSLVRVGLSPTAQRDYNHAVENLEDFLRGVRDDKDYTLSWRAEAIVLLNTLRKVSGVGKIDAVVEAARDLLDEGEQVFIAAWHKEVVDKLWAALSVKHKTVTITGQSSLNEKQAAVDAFQAGTAEVLIGNIVAAGVGFTLTAGRHILVAELPWTPGELQQVEDRLHRIGQNREVISQVFISDVFGGSVDERLWGLLDSKATVVNGVLDGVNTGLALDEGSIANQLLDSYR